MDGGFRDRDEERNTGPELNRNAFGTKKQAMFNSRRERDVGGGGFGRSNMESRNNFDRSNFGTASSGSSNRIGVLGGRREITREKERQPVDDSREWRRREPLKPLGNSRRSFDDRANQAPDRDRDRNREEVRSWRR